LTYLYDDRALSQLLLNPGLTPDAESAQQLDDFYNRIIEMLRASLDFGVSVGLVQKCNTELVASALLGAIRGVTGRLIKLDPPPPIDQVVEDLLSFAWRGVMAPSVWG
jgi:hypothetical protein